MNFSLTFENSPFWLILVLVFALVLSYWQYRPSAHLRDFSRKQLWVLGVLRFLSYFFIMALLLSPMMRFSNHKTEKPILIWAQDNSESLLFNGDSAYYKKNYTKKVKALTESMSDRFEVQNFIFGNSVRVADSFDFTDKFTDYSELFIRLKNDYAVRNVGAVVLASDGLFNKGHNPRYSVQNLPFRIHTLALGDTASVRDVAIKQIRFNRIAFLNNNIPVQVLISAGRFSGQKVNICVTQKQKTLFKKEIFIDRENFYKEINFYIPAKESGLQHYRVEVEPLKDEFTVRNNVRLMVVDVLDSRRKVLLLYNSFHPDIAALRGAIEVNPNYDVELINADEKVKSLSDYDMAILYQLPSIHRDMTFWMKEIDRPGIPVLFVVGGQSDIKRLNELELGVEIIQQKALFEEVQSHFNEQFSLFESTEYEKKVFADLAPLLTPYGDFKIAPDGDVLFFQSIKSVNTSLPLIFFSRKGEQKFAWILGEGLWRWKLHNFMAEQNHEVFNSLINKIVQYLSLKIHKNRLMVQVGRSYSEAENVQLEAHLYNESYEPVNEPEMTLELTDLNKKQYNYIFARTENAYELDLGNIPEGNYHYRASVSLNQKNFESEGDFIVIPEDIETQGIRADHNLMYQLAELSDGKSFNGEQFNDLENELRTDKTIKTIVHTEKTYDNILKYSLFGIILLILIVMEWFLKKVWGGI